MQRIFHGTTHTYIYIIIIINTKTCWNLMIFYFHCKIIHDVSLTCCLADVSVETNFVGTFGGNVSGENNNWLVV